MPASQPPTTTRRTLLQSAVGALAAVLSTLIVSSVWRANELPGATFVAPATFFLGMGTTFALTTPRWRAKSVAFKLLIITLYGVVGAIVVGGLTTLLQ